MFVLVVGAEAHHALALGTVVPGEVEQHDLTCRWKVEDVPLNIELALLALRRCRQGDMPEHPRAHQLGDAADDSALAGRITTLERSNDLGARSLNPGLPLDEIHLEFLNSLAVPPNSAEAIIIALIQRTGLTVLDRLSTNWDREKNRRIWPKLIIAAGLPGSSSIPRGG